MIANTNQFDDYTVSTLAGLAGCGLPASETSPGGAFLRGIANDMPDVLERVALGEEDVSDVVSETANSAPDYRTYTCWQEFADLQAWQEDISEFGDPSAEDLTISVASRALYIIAERLVNVLITEAKEADDDDSDD